VSILDVAESFFNKEGIMGVPNNGTDLSPALWAHWRYGPPVGERVDPAGDTDSPSVEVFVNQGRWMTACPGPNCGSAQVASETDHRFYCATCENDFIAHLTLPVIWPVERESIENLLLPRPVLNQNWRPGETIEDLINENINYGVSG
jgi:hypothetical protein